MSKERDDSILNRLTTFLKETTTLSADRIEQIKPLVFILTVNNEKYIVKGYINVTTIVKQWQLFEKLHYPAIIPFIRFPNRRKYIYWEGYYWTLQPFCTSSKLDYRYAEDRVKAAQLLHQFHQITKGMELTAAPYVPNLIAKWSSRLKRWQQLKAIFIQFEHLSLFQEIEAQLREGIAWFKEVNTPPIEKNDHFRSTWTHGDVASHNFLSDNRGNVYLIDFDLLSSSPYIYDEIQLGQRFLPYIQYDIDQLSMYIQPANDQVYQLYLIGVMLPVDFVREWWYFSIKARSNDDIYAYLVNFRLSWDERIKFIESVKRKLSRR